MGYQTWHLAFCWRVLNFIKNLSDFGGFALTTKRIIFGVAFMVCLLQMAPGLGIVPPAWADRSDVAMFHDALAPHGKWIDYGK